MKRNSRPHEYVQFLSIKKEKRKIRGKKEGSAYDFPLTFEELYNLNTFMMLQLENNHLCG